MNISTKINAIKNLVKETRNMAQVETPIKNYFSNGVYAREMTIPKDTLLVGKIHKTRHLNILSKGSCTVATAARTFYIESPHTFESIEGEQKVIYAHEDLVWTTIHVTDKTNLSDIEKECIADDYDQELINNLIGGIKCLGV